MGKIYLLLFVVLVTFTGALAQNVNVNPGAGSYATLADAFTAINTGTHTGAITVDIVNNTTEPAAGAILNASGAGAASYTSILIQPSGGAFSITGAATAGLPLIDLNGADNVTINGLNSGGNSLTIANTTVSATSGTSTIRFIGGATNNTITNCSIQGSGTMTVATNGATIFFSTDAVTPNGNDNNTISNNNIGPAGSNLPTKAILGNGSTTTTTIGNSGNIINNNNIFDYFGAAVTSSGVAINGGCNTWSITNNRFYQTGTRTWTTGATHRAIDLNSTTATSGVQGMTVTGNIVGYASNTQAGTYTLTGSTGKFQGIVFNGITSGTLSTIDNNTVASISLTGVTSNGTSTASPMVGIMVVSGVANTNNNTIGSQSANGSLTFSTTTTTNTDVYGIFNFSLNNWTSNNNKIGGISVTNAGISGTFLVYGIRANTSTTFTWAAADNLIGGTVANSIQLSATGGSSQVVGMQTPNAISTFARDTIRNLTTNIGTGTTTAASVAGIIFTSATPVQNVSQCVIYNLTNTNTTAATTVVTGIQFTGGTGNVVQSNLIYGLTTATNSPTGEINGIRVGGGTTVYRNNIIAIGAGVPNALGSAASNGGVTGINGINEALGTNSFWHNSVYIGGSPTAGSGASYAFNGSQTVNTRSFRNNIFFNARSNSGASGSNYAVKINGTTANPAGLTINNNVYFANGTGGVFGYFNSANVANLTAWQTAVGQDAVSFESNPQYVDPTNSVPDLHIHPTNPTLIEGNGFDLGVINDYDGQTRSSLTPVDIGADAGNFNGVDLLAPTIAYTPLGFTCATGDRVFTVSITDISGVPTSGSLQPRIYYRKNAGAWFSSQGVLASGSATNGTWTMTIVAADMGGLVIGDNIQYYVIAQDIATTPNLGSNPSVGLVATDVNTVTTAPTTPNNYNITNSISGTYTVGAAGNYPTITAAFNAYNTSCIDGPVVFSLIDPTYTTTSDTLRANGTASSVNTLTIRPAAAGTVINGNLNGPAIVLLDADFITIDGSVAGATVAPCLVGGNAAIRDLTIANTNTGTSAAVISIATGVNGSQNNTIKNVNILGQDPLTSLIGIAVGGNTLGTVGADNDNNSIVNCSVRRSIFGIYNGGANGANRNVGSKITHNDLSGTTTNRIRRVGIMVFNQDGVEITYNHIGGIETNESADAIGIALGVQGIDNTITITGEIVNAIVSHNKINGVASLSTTGFSAAGITIAGGNAGANTISNNMITSITSPATSPDIMTGIFVVGATGSSTNLYHNSVSLTGDRGVVATQTPSFGVAITGTNPIVNMRNNILYNTQVASGGGVNARSYAVGMVTTTFTNLISDYNIYWSTGANDGGFRTGSLGAAAGTDYATVALYAAATATDANSTELLPTFVSDINDLHLLPSASCVTTGKGIAITGIANDIDCNSRNTSPFIGAHEAYEPATGATVISNNNDERTYTMSGGTDFLFDCRLIASVTPGTVAGRMRAKTSIVAPATNPINSEPYGPRVTDLDPTTDGTGTVTLFYTQQDFTDYNTYLTTNSIAYNPIAANPTDPATSNVRIREWHGPNAGTGPGTGNTLLVPTSVTWDAAGNNGNGWWVVTVSAPSFSSFFLTSTPIITPVTLVDFRGEVTGATNTVYWTTATESNNRKFVVERSLDGRNFSSIGDVATRAINGNSSTALHYSFVDANPVQGKQYYRLQMVDNGGRTTYSQIVTLRRGAGKLEIVDVRPNPTTSIVYFNVLGTSTNVNVAVRDLSGKEVIRKGLVQSNSFSIDLSKLANGMYILEAVDVRSGEKAMFKVMKQ